MKKNVLIIFVLASLSACQNNTKKTQSTTNTQADQVTDHQKPAFDQKAYKMKGMIIAKTAFKTFKGKIQATAQRDGMPAVVDFCHDNAIKLTDSIAKANNVVIKRTSHKLRNPQNKPDIDEEAVINEYFKDQKEGKPMEPVVLKDTEGYVHFYAPIKIKAACLQCHGQPGKQIHDDIYQLIKQKYPNDQAVEFKEGDLRGIWDIKFLDKK
ncbi:MAG TPA: DUF3365 domain-containing protein [Flavobacteriales bacterium]|nr:DUF3365 domain-containing protein [Flavobacteriales bacterium]